MKVSSIHSRKIRKPVSVVQDLFATLATQNDRIWPVENWPKMRFKNGFKVGSVGGHGPIRYEIVDYNPQSHVEFKFKKPIRFKGSHKLEIIALDSETTEIRHSIAMTTSGTGTIKWLMVIRWLHDALIEDAFDKVENQLLQSNLNTKWSAWVKLWRWILSPGK